MSTKRNVRTRLALAVCLCVLGALLVAPQATRGTTTGDTPTGPIWNDPTAVPQEYATLAPIPGEGDAAQVLAMPPASVKAECVEWLQRFLAQPALPASVADHLVAVKGWTKAGGTDVFVVSYLVDGRLYDLVDDNCAVTVFTLDEHQSEAVPPEDHAAFVQAVAERLLTPGMLPHPLAPLRVAGLPADTTRGTWLAASLEIEKDPEGPQGRLLLRWPEEPGGSSVWFETDGTFVRFTLFKAYPGSRAFGDRYAPRFDTSESGGKAHWVPPPPDPKTEGEVTPAEGPLEGEAN